MNKLFNWKYLIFFSFFWLFGLSAQVNAQSCPHPACGPGLPCCYGQTRIDKIVDCDYDGAGVCRPTDWDLIWVSCDSGSCSSGSVCSSNDHCVDNIYGCNVAAGCSSATCCGPGVVSSTATPAPTGGGGGPTSTPVPTSTPTSTPTPTPTPTPTTPASCTVTTSGTYTLDVGSTVTVSPNITPVGGTIQSVAFNVGNSSVASVCATSTPNPPGCPAGSGSYTDLTSPYQAYLTGQSSGSTTLSVVVTMNGGATCTQSGGPASVSVTNSVGWWQCVGGDAIAGAGTITSLIPASASSPVLIRDNFSPNGYSGVPSAGTSGAGAINLAAGTPSEEFAGNGRFFSLETTSRSCLTIRPHIES